MHYEVGRRLEISYGYISRGDWRIACRWLIHLWRACGGAIAPNINQIHVPATSGDVIHPRQTFEWEIKCRLSWLGRTVNVQQSFLGLELRHLLRAFVSDV